MAAGAEAEQQQQLKATKRSCPAECDEDAKKRLRELEANFTERVEAAIAERLQEQVRQKTEAEAASNLLMRETFTPNDPVHGLILLPAICKHVVDTRIFQRMRNIKQLAMCSRAFPGATHDRFFHSVGTAFLAYELITGLQRRQPELNVSGRDVLCITLAALCHDLGHPAYSHMFETFVRSLGRKRRRLVQDERLELSAEEEAEISSYEKWNHEQASVMYIRLLFKELALPLTEAGLTADAEGDDWECICELVDPPKKRLSDLLKQGKLKECWPEVMKGRPVQKAWLYEIVSNWRNGLDVDRFDYFRRDAYYLGIQRQFDHGRYLKNVKVIDIPSEVPTISPPEKEKDRLREMLELRKSLHNSAYQCKTVKKLESHMIDILHQLDRHIVLTGSPGPDGHRQRLSMSKAAVQLDPVAYSKILDVVIESTLATGIDSDSDTLRQAALDYDRYILKRNLMRLVADWDLPRPGEAGIDSSAGPMPQPESEEEVVKAVHAKYVSKWLSKPPQDGNCQARSVQVVELRCSFVSCHYGMGAEDPITRVLFHNSKNEAKHLFKPTDSDARPLRQKIFFFWNPSEPSDETTLQRLTAAFHDWANQQVDLHCKSLSSALAAAPAIVPAKPSRKRQLKMQASCPMNDDDALLAAFRPTLLTA
eukprot:TRINITY_DN110552_c0_g1_i1.p1 TRINITY_DN110552_c0_g1~~TRINITY_DN110552_c0_g1_i1.p1  ORF type:complete len:664 (+),score=134.86 TRINITY_DN110552_c0_g1_i1:40-1992(+)